MSHPTFTRFFSKKRVFFAIFIGLAISFYLIYQHTEKEQLDVRLFGKISMIWLVLAFLMIIFREAGYILRLRILTNRKISFRHSFQVIMLWEFASALTPSVVGGSAIAMYIIHKEGIKAGKATALVMITALFDELFYLLTVPFLFLLYSDIQVFSKTYLFLGYHLPMKTIFFIGYGFMLFLLLFISFAIFISPKSIRRFLFFLFSLPFLKRWLLPVLRFGKDLHMTSIEVKSKPLGFWFSLFIVTSLSWSARFLFVNFLIAAFSPVNNHLEIYATQMIMWVIMLISPTPGAAGVAELLFQNFLSDFIPSGIAPILGLFWRFFSYYIYLIIGAIVLPLWLRRVFTSDKKLSTFV